MPLIGNPRNLAESFGLALNVFRLFGLFPFLYIAHENKFVVSRGLLVVTVLHIIIYTYVNITALMDNWSNFAQPMIVHSSLAAFGNLIFRLYDILNTFLILVPPIIASTSYVSFLNVYMKICDEFVLLNIDVSSVYQRLYYLSFISIIVLVVSILFSAWHSIYFYELITQQPPEFKFYLVATLSNLYKRLYLLYGNSNLICICMITAQLNDFIKNILKKYKYNYESERFLKYSWLKYHKEERLQN